MTNSATSNYWENSIPNDGSFEATECYAAIQDGRWVKGCAFGKASQFQRRFALGVIKQDNKKQQDKGPSP